MKDNANNSLADVPWLIIMFNLYQLINDCILEIAGTVCHIDGMNLTNTRGIRQLQRDASKSITCIHYGIINLL